MKQDFFNHMLSKIKNNDEVEILTDQQSLAVKGGGCTCKKGGYVSCTGTYDQNGDNNGGDNGDTTVDPTIELPKDLGFTHP